MTDLINNYTQSCNLVEQRISELSKLRNDLLKCGDSVSAQELDLDRRIKILYVEHGELKAVISHLISYNRRSERYVKS